MCSRYGRDAARSALIHLLCPVRIVRLQWRQHITRLLCNGRHLLSVAPRLVPFSKRGITTNKNFQARPPIRANLQGPCGRFEPCLRVAREKPRERKKIKPDKILRVVWA